jgi:low temperature requirement protein LtrA
MVAGIVLIALGIKKTTAHVDHPLETVPAVALFGGIALCYAGHIGFRLRNVGSMNWHRLVAALLCLALIPFADQIDALAALTAAAAITALLVVYETLRFAEARRRLRAAAP